MATSVVLTGKFVGQQQINAAFKGIEGSLTGLERKSASISATLNKTGNSLVSLGTKLSIAITAPIVAAGTALGKFAIEAVESENLFEVSLGNMAGEARAFSEELSRTLGINQFEMRRQIGVVFTMASSMGLAEDAALDLAQGVSLLAQDLASFRNLRPEDAFEKLQAAITGEAEPLKRLGINIQEAAVEMEALRLGITTSTAEMTQQQKTLLRWSAILQQTQNDQTDLARTLESPANQLRIMRSRIEEAATSLGVQLLPAIQAALKPIGDLVRLIKDGIDRFNELTPRIKGTTIVVIGLAAGLPLLVTGLGFVLKAAAALVVFLTGPFVAALKGAAVALAFLVTPAGLAVTAIAGLGVAGVVLAEAWEGIGNRLRVIWLDIERDIQMRVLGIVNTLKDLPVGFEETLEGIRLGTKLRIDQINREIDRLGGASTFGDQLSDVAFEIEDAWDRTTGRVTGTIRKLQAEISSVILEIGGGSVGRAGGVGSAGVGGGFVQFTEEQTDAVQRLGSLYQDLIKSAEESARESFEAASGVDALGSASTSAAEASKILKTELEGVAASISDVNSRSRDIQDALSALELQKLEFRIDLGEAEIPDKIAALQERLIEAQSRAEEAVVESQAVMDKARELSADKSSEVAKRIMDDAMAISQGLEREAIRQQEIELRTREAIADAFEEMAREQIEGLGDITMANAAAAKMQLEQWRRFYEQQGELAAKGAEVIKEKSAEVMEQVNADIKAMTDEAISNVQAINKSFGDLFADVLVDGADFKEGFISIIKGLAKDLISTNIQNILGGILTPGQPQQQSQVGGLFSVLGGLFGGGGQQQQASGGRAGGVGGVGVGGGFGAAGVPFPLPGAGPGPLSLLGGPIGAGLGAGALLLPFLGPVTDAIGGFGKGLLNVFSGGTDAVGSAISGFGSGLQSVFSSGLGGLGSVLTNFVSGLTDALSSIIPGFGGLLGGGGFLGGIGNIFGSIGSLFGGFFQHGGSFVTQGPSLIGVGEVAERVTVTPLGGRAAGNGLNLIVQGNLFMDEVSAVSLEKLMQRAVRSGAGSTI